MASQKSHGNRTVVLVGRPNVGKSTLFNRVTGTRRAIVAPIAGTTRDIIAADAEWQGAHITVVDTGGMFGASKDPLHELVLQQGHRAIATADLHRVRHRRQGRARVGRRGDRGDGAAERAARHRRGQQDRRPQGAGARRRVLRAGVRPGDRDRGRARLRRRRPARRGDQPAGHRQDRGARRASRDEGRDHRPAERRQVVAGQPAAQGRAHGGERDGRHHPRPGRLDPASGTSSSFASSTPPASAAPARWRARARSRRSA